MDAGMTLDAFLWPRHPVFGGKYEKIAEAKPIFGSPRDDVRMCAVHSMVMDDVLALEHHYPLTLQYASALAQRGSVMVFEFVVGVVTAKAPGHDAVVFPPLLDVGDERRIEHHRTNGTVG